MDNNKIDFWSLVEYDTASKRLKDCTGNVYRCLNIAAKDIASVILRLSSNGTPGFSFSDGTIEDLKRIASSSGLYSTEFIMDVFTTCLKDDIEHSSVFLNAIHDDCPHSYEYYILACNLLS